MKLAVIAKSAWKDLPSRVDALAAVLSSKLPAKVDISIILKDYGDIPADANGRITAAFLDKTLAVGKEYDGACLLVSLSDRKKYGLKPTLRGHYLRDEDGYVEFWVASDRLTKRKGKPQFEETFKHELCHGLYHWLGVPRTTDETRHLPGHDNTHYFHDAEGSLDGAFAEIRAAWPKPKPVPKEDANLAGLVPAAKRAALKLRRYAREGGIPIRYTAGRRTSADQAFEYAKGRTAPGKIATNAKPGQSDHEYGVAVDFCFEGKTQAECYPRDDDPKWRNLWAIASVCGFDDWGGLWKPNGWDKPHLAVTKGKSWRDFSKPGFDWTPWS